MKKKCIVVLLAIMAMLVVIPTTMSDPPPPPNPIKLTDLEEGWNMIGVPVDIPVNETYVRVNWDFCSWDEAISYDNDFGTPIVLNTVYGWNATSGTYLATSIFEKDSGYWMYAYMPCELWKML